MNRREWLRNAALIAAGAVAADQLDLIERIGWRRRFFPAPGGLGNVTLYRLRDGQREIDTIARLWSLEQEVVYPIRESGLYDVRVRWDLAGHVIERGIVWPLHVTRGNTVTVPTYIRLTRD